MSRPLEWDVIDWERSGPAHTANSTVHDDGRPFRYRVTKQGKEFSVGHSDHELLSDPVDPFPDLAQAYCQNNEYMLVRSLEDDYKRKEGGG